MQLRDEFSETEAQTSRHAANGNVAVVLRPYMRAALSSNYGFIGIEPGVAIATSARQTEAPLD